MTTMKTFNRSHLVRLGTRRLAGAVGVVATLAGIAVGLLNIKTLMGGQPGIVIIGTLGLCACSIVVATLAAAVNAHHIAEDTSGLASSEIEEL